MSQLLFRSLRTSDLELFDVDPGPNSGWELVGTVAPAARANVSKLIEQQNALAAHERRLHEDLITARGQLDSVTTEIDRVVATPELVLRALAKARSPMDQDEFEPPPPKQFTKLSTEEFMELFHRADRKRRGLE